MKKQDDEKRKKMGRRIAEARHAANMSQEELRDVLGLKGNIIYLYESGRRGTSGVTLYRLASALNVSQAYLIGESDDASPPVRGTAMPMGDDAGDDRAMSETPPPQPATAADVARVADAVERQREEFVGAIRTLTEVLGDAFKQLPGEIARAQARVMSDLEKRAGGETGKRAEAG